MGRKKHSRPRTRSRRRRDDRPQRKHKKRRSATPTPRRDSRHEATVSRRPGWDKLPEDASDETYVGTLPRPRPPQSPLGVGLQHNGIFFCGGVADPVSPYGAFNANRLLPIGAMPQLNLRPPPTPAQRAPEAAIQEHFDTTQPVPKAMGRTP